MVGRHVVRVAAGFQVASSYSLRVPSGLKRVEPGAGAKELARSEAGNGSSGCGGSKVGTSVASTPEPEGVDETELPSPTARSAAMTGGGVLPSGRSFST